MKRNCKKKIINEFTNNNFKFGLSTKREVFKEEGSGFLLLLLPRLITEKQTVDPRN